MHWEPLSKRNIRGVTQWVTGCCFLKTDNVAPVQVQRFYFFSKKQTHRLCDLVEQRWKLWSSMYTQSDYYPSRINGQVHGADTPTLRSHTRATRRMRSAVAGCVPLASDPSRPSAKVARPRTRKVALRDYSVAPRRQPGNLQKDHGFAEWPQPYTGIHPDRVWTMHEACCPRVRGLPLFRVLSARGGTGLDSRFT